MVELGWEIQPAKLWLRWRKRFVRVKSGQTHTLSLTFSCMRMHKWMRFFSKQRERFLCNKHKMNTNSCKWKLKYTSLIIFETVRHAPMDTAPVFFFFFFHSPSLTLTSSITECNRSMVKFFSFQLWLLLTHFPKKQEKIRCSVFYFASAKSKKKCYLP